MAKSKINRRYRELFKRVLSEAAQKSKFRKLLLSENRKTAEDAIIDFVKDPSLSKEIKEIVDVLYKNATAYNRLTPDSRSLIQLLAYLCGDLKLPPDEIKSLRGLSAPGDYFDDIEDWEQFY